MYTIARIEIWTEDDLSDTTEDDLSDIFDEINQFLLKIDWPKGTKPVIVTASDLLRWPGSGK